MLSPGFDAILADVPCSATGVMRRNPDVKLLRRTVDIRQFAEQQLAILQGLWPALKPGGRLLYVTCSLLDAENDAVVNSHLSATRRFTSCRLRWSEASRGTLAGK